jgi:hypothetical protein
MNLVLHRLLATLGLAALAMSTSLLSSSALAGGNGPLLSTGPQAESRSHVLSPSARPYGYSLSEMARITAVFNESDRKGPAPQVPFQILFDDGSGRPSFKVSHGTHLYVPIVYNDDSLPLLGDFPANVENRQKLRYYWYSQEEVGAVATEVIVDGNSVELPASYTVGVKLAQPLPNGANNYITSAAFIAPLTYGTHTVGIHFKATGAALSKPPFDHIVPGGVFEFFSTYIVVVD